MNPIGDQIPEKKANEYVWYHEFNLMKSKLDEAIENVNSGRSNFIGQEASLPKRLFIDPNKYAQSEPFEQCTVETPDGTGVVTHPSVLYFPTGWNGHKYWMAITPYFAANAEIEDPCILVSSDGTIWTAPEGVVNPLVPSPPGGAYNSDTHLVLGPDDRLYIFWRDSGVSGQDRILVINSADGVTWSEPEIIFATNNTVMRLLSPAVWYDHAAQEWVMLTVDMIPSPNKVMRMTCETVNGEWSVPVEVPVSPSFPIDEEPWHIDAKLIGDTVVILIDETDIDETSMGGLYLCVSNDAGKTITRARNTIAWGDYYRSSFIPALSENGFSIDLYAGKIDSLLRGRVKNIGSMDDYFLSNSQKITAAVRASYPYAVGDDFNRADTEAGLGISTSGVAWTASAGTHGITGKKAYTTTTNNTRSFLETSISDKEAGVIVTEYVNQAWLIVRGIDASNYIRIGFPTSNRIEIQKIVAGTLTVISTVFFAPIPLYKFTVRCVGENISVNVNNRFLLEATESDLIAGTLIGIQGNSKFSDIYAKSIL